MKLLALGLFVVTQLECVNGDANAPVLAINGLKIELDPTVQHVPLASALEHLRPPPAQIPEAFDIFVGSSVFRDAFRCGQTFFSALSRASNPDRLRFGLIEQVYEEDGRCIDEYCKLAEEKWPDKGSCPYKSQIQVETHSAAEARGCTTARHLQQKLIGNEEFCLQVDAHSYFIKGWDELLVADWSRIDNEMAVLTTYPYEVYDFVHTEETPSLGQYPHLCSYLPFGNGKVMYPRSGMISNYQTPQMGAFWGGGLSFGKCHAEKNVPVDPHMPWLWDGEEFLRSGILWTHGYDLYSPSERGSVVFHNYTKNSNQRSWISAVDKETKELEAEKSLNRYRLQVEVPFDGPVNTFELSEYSFGNARSYREYLQFSNVSFADGVEDISPCRQLHWTPYSNATAVEEILGGKWAMSHTEKSTSGVAKVVEINDQRNNTVDAMEHAAIPAKLRDAKELAYSRQEKATFAIETAFVAPMWFMLGLLVAAIFVGVSNDSRSRTFRNSCSSTRFATKEGSEAEQLP